MTHRYSVEPIPSLTPYTYVRFQLVQMEPQPIRVITGSQRRNAADVDMLKAQLESCADCRRVPVEGGPSHWGSPLCRDGRSLKSGGGRAHCRCESCYGVTNQKGSNHG